MRPDTVNRSIQCSYTPEEKAEIAKSMAASQADMEAAESEKKVSDAAYNERIKKHSADISNLAKKYNKGYEMKELSCDIRYDDPATGQKTFYRMDTKEAVETLEMSWEEKQEELQFNLPADGAPDTTPAPGDDLEKATGLESGETGEPPIDWKLPENPTTQPPEDFGDNPPPASPA